MIASNLGIGCHVVLSFSIRVTIAGPSYGIFTFSIPGKSM